MSVSFIAELSPVYCCLVFLSIFDLVDIYGYGYIHTAFLKAEFHVGTIQMKSQPNVWIWHICPVPKKPWSKKKCQDPNPGPHRSLFPRMNPKDKFGLKAKVPVGHIRYTHPLATPCRAQAELPGSDSPFSILQVTEA